MFKVILNSVPIGNFPETFNLGNVLLDPADRWQGYPAAQQELIGFIEQTPVSGVLFLSGDFHLACCGKVSPTGLGSQTIEVLAGPGRQVANPLHGLLKPPQFDWATKAMNYAALHLDPQARTVDVVHHGDAGQVLAQRQYTV